MLFGTFDFLMFLAAVIALNWLLKPYPLIWRLFLLIASVYFYALIDIKYVTLLAGASLITFILGLLISNKRSKASKPAFIIGIIVNLGLLFIYKYYDFFRISVESCFASFNLKLTFPYWEIIAPIGISFFSFRMLSYLIDLNRQKYKAETSLLDFLIYCFFFPYLLAGPITRANEFLPQLKNGGAKTINKLEPSVTLFFVGLFKKLVLSTWLSSALLINDVFAVPEQFSSLAILAAILGYAFVIYCDFSGYSDMAIACANFLGFELSPNFLFPYRANSIGEFWRRWHISFYKWMLDYLYIPLGGNRVSKFRSYLNVLIVFIASGLWHGAALHYLIWGLWHGLGLTIERAWSNLKNVNTFLKKSLTGFLGWLITFIFVVFGWIFFKAENMERAFAVIKGLGQWHKSANTLSVSIIIIAVLIALFIFFEQKIIEFINKIQTLMPISVWLLFWISLGIIIYKLAPNTIPPFIYFSF
ncbi:MAG TPA: MBOAT family O-acyltransferase [Candidatus Pacearchaeota archaeon]|jgi:alginate O-acetyltransferase complex protein AlgI|nr:MBOAT family O-acyltransferase [Candidatus Pacearchaeota archaeon]HRR94973.1 MBOAT family O-acyltransferase [Candidatus Paceibacterota bacterium]HPC30791.1 MBOAT family O-acyltransferase [Candidatus Pacearchaeota archaeon]HQG09486.1 MBOAT family O-acyltransferase [Candidatus Pacearchaeota archaeon]HQH20432.1 MBOAT family O-acyltransferase [Candidatus Pacearchaeota archaeon]